MFNLSRRKSFATGLLLLFLVGCLCFFGLFRYGSQISQDVLNRLFQEKSEGKYSMEYDKLDISILYSRLDIRNFRIRPKLNSDESPIDSTQALYYVTIPQLSIDLHSIADIYFQKTLSFQNIEITDPTMKMERFKEGKKKQSFSLEAGDLYKLIDDYLLEFSLDSLKINNAALGYQSKIPTKELKVLLDNIFFTLQNFAIDQTSQNGQFLFSGGFSLHLTNQHFLLSDSLHYSSFERLSLSTAQSKIFVKNLEVKQRNDKTYSQKSGLNRYDIDIPEITLEGVNFAEAYENNALLLQKVIIKQPDFNIRQKNQAAKGSANDIPNLISHLFNEIDVEQMIIEKANSSFQVDYGDQNQAFRFINSNLLIEGFRLDSNYINNTASTKLFDNISLNSDQNEFVFRDSSHSVSFDQLRFSSVDSTFSFERFSIAPIHTAIGQNRIESNIKSLEIKGFDMKSLLMNKKISLKSLTVSDPMIDLQLKVNPSQSSSSSTWFNTFKLDEFNIKNGLIIVQSDSFSFNASDINTVVNRINWKPQASQKLLQILALGEFNSKNSHFRNKDLDLRINQISASDRWQKIKLQSIVGQVNNQPFPVTSDGLTLTGLDIFSLLTKEKIHFDELLVDQPAVKLVQSDSNNSNFNKSLHKVSFNKIGLNKANITLFKPDMTPITEIMGFSSSITHFRYDSLVNEYFADPSIRIDSVNFGLSKIKHHVTLEKIDINALESSLSINKIKVIPNEDAMNMITINGDSLDLFGINIHELINNQHLIFDIGKISNTSFDFALLESDTAKEINVPIVFRKFNFSNNQLSFQNKSGLAIQSDFNLTISDFDQKSDAPLLAKSYQIDGSSLTVNTIALDEPVSIGKYNINSDSGNWSLTDVKISKRNSFVALLPQVELKAFILDSLIQSRSLSLDTVLIFNPVVSITQDSTQKDSSTSKFINANIKYLHVDNADIKIKLHSGKPSDTLKLNNFNFSLDQLDYKSDLKNSPLEIVENFRFDGADFAYELPGEMFTLRTKHYAFNSTLSHLNLKRFRIEPKYNRGEFQRQLTYQADWIDAEIQQLDVYEISLEALMNGDIDIGTISMNRLNLDTHRDKRLPLEENIYKSLPQKALKSLATSIKIDTVKFDRSFISHSEFSEEGTSPGVIFFRNLDGMITNITNDSAAISQNPKMTVYVAGTIMNTGNIMIQSIFDYQDSLDRFTLRGTVGEMELPELNRFLENTASVRIRDGLNKSLSFAFEGNEEYALGEMTFYYRNLKISVLDADTHQRKGHGASIKSFFANTFVVNSKNPRFLFVRDGDIYMERDKEKSVFSYWGKSLVSGLVSSIGAKNNKKKIKALANKVKQGLNLSKEE